LFNPAFQHCAGFYRSAGTMDQNQGGSDQSALKSIQITALKVFQAVFQANKKF
jgi:hypothetical protein